MSCEDAKRRAVFYQALADGRTLQYKEDDDWLDIIDFDSVDFLLLMVMFASSQQHKENKR